MVFFVVYNSGMNMYMLQGGFIKKLTVIVVGICIAFVVLTALATSAPLSQVTTGVSPLSESRSYIDDTRSVSSGAEINPLLDFLGNTENTGSRSVPNTDGKGVSVYAGAITLSSGNTSTAQPVEEYVILRNGGKSSVDVTGWALVNSKGSRPIQNSGNSYFYPSADVALIGQGTEFLDPKGVFKVTNIVLKPGDSAYVTTGGPFSQFPFSIYTSFRENICEGYLEDYPFNPTLNRRCPSITRDPQIKTVTDECYDYIASLRTCPNPERTDKKKYDEQPSHCKAFLAERIGYAMCVKQNQFSADFSLKQWRVFLGQKKEMWASSRETITLYDKEGKVVDQISY